MMSEKSKYIILQYSSRCELCGMLLSKGSRAKYFIGKKKVQCLGHENIKTLRSAGKSAEEKALSIEAKRKERFESIGFIGKIIYPFLDPSIEAQKWAKGAKGERIIGKILDEIAEKNNFKVLHDRAIPNSKANIDHILVTEKGVFIIDAKNYSGKVEIRNKGSWLFPEKDKLFVDGRDRGNLIEGVKWQVKRVKEELDKNNLNPSLCGILGFVDANWPLFEKQLQIDSIYLNNKGLTYIFNKFIPSSECDVEETFFVIDKIFKCK
jgi:hypothetical protein